MLNIKSSSQIVRIESEQLKLTFGHRVTVALFVVISWLWCTELEFGDAVIVGRNLLVVVTGEDIAIFG